jgi:TonB family protein
MYGYAAQRLCVRLGRAIFSSLLLENRFRRNMEIRAITDFFAASRHGTRHFALPAILAAAALAGIGSIASGATPAAEFPVNPGEPAPHLATDRTGTIPTRNDATLKLTTDLGSVRIVSLEAGAAPIVRYSVHIETDARAPIAKSLLDGYVLKAKATPYGVEIVGSLPPQVGRDAASGAQFWIQFEVAVPPGYGVEVKTEAGDIESQDIGGTALLNTEGGNIRTGRIGFGLHRVISGRPVAHLETQGGHIQVQDVAGDLTAFTAGGYVNVENVNGDASLKSGGGHIRAGQIGGKADLETDGGNITVGQAASYVSVRTGGGQIDFGEVRGSVHAETGGGGIRIIYVSGPMEVESSGGSICLTRVAGTVQAATGSGTITAWINPDASSNSNTVHLTGASQLASGNGDIVVFLPRNLAANIEATVGSGGERRIEADPALHLTMQPAGGSGAGQVHATAVLNGGGAPLKLRTTSGKIRLQFLDKEMALQQSLVRDQVERLKRSGVEPLGYAVKVSLPNPPRPVAADSPEVRTDWLERWLNSLEIAIKGGLSEDPEEFPKRLTYSPKPAYPIVAQRAGIEGYVKLQVRVTKDGRVEVMKVLDGDPELADASITAVKQWRGRPMVVNGQPLEVISLVTFNFQLH